MSSNTRQGAQAQRDDRPTIVLVSHSFPPDPAAVGQHVSDLASELARTGKHRILVFTSDRGYEDASLAYPAAETRADAVEVQRIPFSSFGKSSLPVRVAAIASFMLQSMIRTARVRNLAGFVYTTSPPFIGVAATIVARIRAVRTVFWAMDLNPEQLVALGKLAPQGVLTRTLQAMNRWFLTRAEVVITLDQLMAERLKSAGANPSSVVVIPPWSPDNELHAIPRELNAFRAAHALSGSTVIMYSGNHTPSNPLSTLLAAAVALRGDSRLRFVFIGSGGAKREVESLVSAHSLTNVLSLPYQPRSALGESLSAGDVHVVSLGNPMAGVIHPCKVYGAMAVGRPILYFGPAASHIDDILQSCNNGWRVDHDAVEAAVAVLRMIAGSPYVYLDDAGERGHAMLQQQFSPAQLVNSVARTVERALDAQRAS